MRRSVVVRESVDGQLRVHHVAVRHRSVKIVCNVEICFFSGTDGRGRRERYRSARVVTGRQLSVPRSERRITHVARAGSAAVSPQLDRQQLGTRQRIGRRLVNLKRRHCDRAREPIDYLKCQYRHFRLPGGRFKPRYVHRAYADVVAERRHRSSRRFVRQRTAQIDRHVLRRRRFDIRQRNRTDAVRQVALHLVRVSRRVRRRECSAGQRRTHKVHRIRAPPRVFRFRERHRHVRIRVSHRVSIRAVVQIFVNVFRFECDNALPLNTRLRRRRVRKDHHRHKINLRGSRGTEISARYRRNRRRVVLEFYPTGFYRRVYRSPVRVRTAGVECRVDVI